MNIPTSYIEWVDAITFIRDHPKNDMYIDNLNNGRLDCDDIMLLRLKNTIVDCINNRLSKEVESFTNYFNGPVEYNSFSLKLIALKKEFNYCKKIANIKIFPKEIHEELNKSLDEKADMIQDILEKQTLRADKSGVINSIIRNNPINK